MRSILVGGQISCEFRMNSDCGEQVIVLFAQRQNPGRIARIGAWHDNRADARITRALDNPRPYAASDRRGFARRDIIINQMAMSIY